MSTEEKIDEVLYDAIALTTETNMVNIERDPEYQKALAALLAIIAEECQEARIDLLIRIANEEGWEESAWVYCTDKNIGLSPNEFEKLRHRTVGLKAANGGERKAPSSGSGTANNQYGFTDPQAHW